MDVAAVAAQVTGAALVLLALADVFLTVLLPASGRGPVREPLSRSIWRLFRWLAGRAGRRRASVLA